MRRVTTLLLIILFSLLPFGTPFAGKGALIKVINSRDKPLKYSFS
nr:hypothetical protein [uncultured Desulfobulbus sp.]